MNCLIWKIIFSQLANNCCETNLQFYRIFLFYEVTRKVLKVHSFELHNICKLSFISVRDLGSIFVGCETFLESDSSDILVLFKITLEWIYTLYLPENKIHFFLHIDIAWYTLLYTLISYPIPHPASFAWTGVLKVISLVQRLKQQIMRFSWVWYYIWRYYI